MKKFFIALRVFVCACCLGIASMASAADIWRHPGPYSGGEGMDTWFGTVYNTSAQHDYRLRVGGWGDAYFSLLRFDLSGLPQVATSARIWLYPISDGGTPTPINWYRIGAQWHTSTVTKDNFFSSQSLTGLFTSVSPTLGQWYVIDITTEYNQWRAGTSSLNYGMLLAPVYNNNNYSSFSSWTQPEGPWIQVTYTPQADDNVLKLKWPLATSYVKPDPGQAFGIDSAGVPFCGGLAKKHNGTDFSAVAGTAVYAAEDGVVKEVLNPSQTNGWFYNIVLQHTRLTGEKFTTVYWHVIPTADVIWSNPGGFIPKGTQIATVADLGANSHLHFGVRTAPYVENVSGTGALPQTTCTGPNGITYPAFPADFVDSDNTSNVLFQ